jgi:NAD(P)-dependent dehydrogenase (short-subunit alcohol dehydrogenase family)
VSRSDEVKAMVAATVQTYGRLDIVVNNAAYMHDSRESSSVTGTTEEDWDLSMGVTLDGVFRVSKYALPEMIKGGGGVIVNIGSIVAAVVVPNLAAYCSAKAGVVHLTKSMALDYGLDNVRVNVICPGIIETPSAAPELADPERRRFLLSRTILDRPGRPEEVACAALFLASEESSYITGAVLMVDGGWSAK